MLLSIIPSCPQRLIGVVGLSLADCRHVKHPGHREVDYWLVIPREFSELWPRLFSLPLVRKSGEKEAVSLRLQCFKWARKLAVLAVRDESPNRIIISGCASQYHTEPCCHLTRKAQSEVARKPLQHLLLRVLQALPLFWIIRITSYSKAMPSRSVHFVLHLGHLSS